MVNKRTKPLGVKLKKYKQINDVFDWFTLIYIDLSRVVSVN